MKSHFAAAPPFFAQKNAKIHRILIEIAFELWYYKLYGIMPRCGLSAPEQRG